jgi:CrcB protein
MTSSRFDPRRISAIFAGGVIGALIRVGLAQAFPAGPGGWPWATFAVNMAGAVLLGYFVARLRDHPEDGVTHPFLTTGICGTLTTFSTMQLELFEMVDSAEVGLAAAYLCPTLIGGYLFVRIGLAIEHRGTPLLRLAKESPREAER